MSKVLNLVKTNSALYRPKNNAPRLVPERVNFNTTENMIFSDYTKFCKIVHTLL